MTVEEKDDLFLFLRIYDISFDIFSSSIELNQEDEAILNNIVRFGVDFGEDISMEIEQYLKNKNKSFQERKTEEPVVAFFKDTYNTIKSYKFMLGNALKSYVVYSAFGHFLQYPFFDYRGRKYYISPFFNLQAHSFIAAFVKLWETIENGQDLKKAVIASLKDPGVIEKANNVSCSAEALDERIIDYFVSHLNITKSEFLEFYNNVNSSEFIKIYQFFIKNLKKKEKKLKAYKLCDARKAACLRWIHQLL